MNGEPMYHAHNRADGCVGRGLLNGVVEAT